jgi:TonB family protein
MLPRALLFSSDEQTSGLLTQALAELSIEVEQCPEIFAAIEKLTTRNYQIVIADWVQEVEASFFLKAARELELGHSTFSLAVVHEKDTAAAFQTGVNEILAKPVSSEQVKNILTAALEVVCPDAARTSVEAGKQENVPPSGPEEPLSERLPAEAPSRARTGGDQPYIENFSSPRESFSFGGYVGKQLAPASSKQLGRRFAWLGGLAVLATIAFGGWKLGYGGETLKFRRASTSADKTVEMKPVVEERQATSTAGENEEVGWVAGLQNADGAPEDRYPPVSRAHIRVRPVLPPSQNTKSRPADPPPSTVAVNMNLAPEIPDSLLVSVPAMTGKTMAPTPHTPGTQWTVDPLMLPEEVSRHMLVHRVLPIYPERALGTGLQGAVVLQAWVGRDGSVRDVKLIRGYLVLGEAAFQAVRQWRYQPYRLNGEIVEMQTFVTVDFRRP